MRNHQRRTTDTRKMPMTDDLLSDEQLDALWATLGPTPTDADFARAAIKAHMDALAKPPLTAESEAEFVEWCRHNCSSGADGSAWYRTIWRAAWNAALSTLAKRGLEDLRDAVFEHLHKAIGYCGHCGKKTRRRQAIKLQTHRSQFRRDYSSKRLTQPQRRETQVLSDEQIDDYFRNYPNRAKMVRAIEAEVRAECEARARRSADRH